MRVSRSLLLSLVGLLVSVAEASVPAHYYTFAFKDEQTLLMGQSGSLASVEDGGTLCLNLPDKWTEVNIMADHFEAPENAKQNTNCDPKDGMLASVSTVENSWALNADLPVTSLCLHAKVHRKE